MTVLLAATTQRNLAIAVAIVLVVGWLLFVVSANARKGTDELEIELATAPNRKAPLADDALEGPRLDQALRWGLVTLAISAVGLPLYWLAEPGRQAGAERGFAVDAVKRGAHLFAPTAEGGFNCAGCHGPEGVGGSTSFTLTDPVTGELSQVSWAAPALDTVLLRFDEEEVRRIITYGRKGTPMPAWGTEGGGPMNSQQVDDLVAYLQSIKITPEAAREQATEELAEAGEVPAHAGKAEGELLFEANCARCHTFGWSYRDDDHPPGPAGGGAFGPNLRGGVTVRQFPRVEDHLDFLAAIDDVDKGLLEGEQVARGTRFEVQYGLRGIGSGRMPGFGLMLTAEQIKAIVEYERGL